MMGSSCLGIRCDHALPLNTLKFGEGFLPAFIIIEEIGIFSVKHFPYLAKFWLSSRSDEPFL